MPISFKAPWSATAGPDGEDRCLPEILASEANAATAWPSGCLLGGGARALCVGSVARSTQTSNRGAPKQRLEFVPSVHVLLHLVTSLPCRGFATKSGQQVINVSISLITKCGRAVELWDMENGREKRSPPSLKEDGSWPSVSSASPSLWRWHGAGPLGWQSGLSPPRTRSTSAPTHGRKESVCRHGTTIFGGLLIIVVLIYHKYSIVQVKKIRNEKPRCVLRSQFFLKKHMYASRKIWKAKYQTFTSEW